MPYWLGAVLSVLLLLTALVIWQARILSRRRFWCRACGRLFRLPWTKLLFRQHIQEDWLLRCPYCGEKGWCTAKRNGKRGCK